MSSAGRKTSIHALGRPHKANKYLLPVARHKNICPLLAEPDRLHQHMPSAGRMRETNTKQQKTFCRTIQHNGGLDSLFDHILCSSIQGTYFPEIISPDHQSGILKRHISSCAEAKNGPIFSKNSAPPPFGRRRFYTILVLRLKFFFGASAMNRPGLRDLRPSGCSGPGGN